MIPKTIEDYLKEPVFCFTSDIDWAIEEDIANLINIFQTDKIPLTPFITHPSDVIKKEYSKMKEKVGVHPNFLPGSTQGKTESEVIQYVKNLWPESTFFRTHSLYENGHLIIDLFKKGYLFESNLLLAPKPNIVPMQHYFGPIIFPITWSDSGVIFKNKQEFNLEKLLPFLESPGLKMFIFHPLHVALNDPSFDFYQEYKKTGKRVKFEGIGICSFLRQVFDFVKDNGHKSHYLFDLYKNLVIE